MLTIHRYGLLDTVRSPTFATLLFLAGMLIMLCAYPLVSLDTDIWYHLAGGRYLFEHGTILTSSSFSFIEPQHEFVNYYWMYQAIVYGAHALMGPTGIILLRATIYTATIVCLLQISTSSAANDRSEKSTAAFLLALTSSLCLLPRDINPRPHLVSYLLLTMTLLILKRRRHLWILPLIGIVWANIHGVSYPIFLLPIIALLSEDLLSLIRALQDRIHGERLTSKQRRLLIASLYTPLITPFGFDMLKAPWIVLRFTDYYILEAAKLPHLGLTQYFFDSAPEILSSLLPLLQLAGIAAFVILAVARRLAVHHVLLAGSALTLMSMHHRMGYEAMLLLLPITSEALELRAPEMRLISLRQWCRPALSALALILAFFYLSPWPAWPLSYTGIPSGIARFLQTVNTGGKVFNAPDSGGYLEWSLPNSYKIYMDFQMSLFDDYDIFFARYAKTNLNALKKFVDKYTPEYICVDGRSKSLGAVIEASGLYALVFFDDREALYANRGSLPALVEHHEVKHVSPWDLDKLSGSIDPKEIDNALFEIDRMLGIYPDALLLNVAGGILRLARGNPELARKHAETAMSAHPQEPSPYSLAGDIAKSQERYSDAMAYYMQAMKRLREPASIGLIRNIFTMHNKLQENRIAYEFLLGHINPFLPTIDATDLANLGFSAASIGKAQEATLFLRMAKLKTPKDNSELHKKIDTLLLLLPPFGNTN